MSMGTARAAVAAAFALVSSAGLAAAQDQPAAAPGTQVDSRAAIGRMTEALVAGCSGGLAGVCGFDAVLTAQAGAAAAAWRSCESGDAEACADFQIVFRQLQSEWWAFEGWFAAAGGASPDLDSQAQALADQIALETLNASPLRPLYRGPVDDGWDCVERPTGPACEGHRQFIESLRE